MAQGPLSFPSPRFAYDVQIPVELSIKWRGSGCFVSNGQYPDQVAGVPVGYYWILGVFCSRSRTAFLSCSVLKVRRDKLFQAFGFPYDFPCWWSVVHCCCFEVFLSLVALYVYSLLANCCHLSPVRPHAVTLSPFGRGAGKFELALPVFRRAW